MNTDQFDTFVEDFLGEKLNRPIIIVGASKIDDLLYNILSNFLLSPIDKKNDELLKGDNPLSTFSSRIKIIYRLGIIDDQIFGILEKLRKLRNLCAHSIEFDIRKSPVREHFSDLKKSLISRESYALTKKRYFSDVFLLTDELQCLLVTICVILESINASTKKTSGLKKTLNISKK